MTNPFFLVFDVETNDMPNFSLRADHPSNARIIQIGAALLDAELNIIDTMNELIRPEGWTIAPGAFRAHGISLERCHSCGSWISDVVERFDALEDRITPSGTLVAYNVRFDAKLIRGERRRLSLPDRWAAVRSFDPMRAATPICALPPTEAMIRSGRNWNKSPKLSEAFEILTGRKMESAHDAFSDVKATIEVMRALRQRGIDLTGTYPPTTKDAA